MRKERKGVNEERELERNEGEGKYGKRKEGKGRGKW